MKKEDKSFMFFLIFILICGNLTFLTKGIIQWISFGIICMVALLILISFFFDKK